MKTFDSCTVRAQSPISIGVRVQFRRREHLSLIPESNRMRLNAEQVMYASFAMAETPSGTSAVVVVAIGEEDFR